MDYTVRDLISIAHAISDIERGFNRARRRNKEIDFRLDRVPIHLRDTLVGHAVRGDDDRLTFQPIVGEQVGETFHAALPDDDASTDVIVLSETTPGQPFAAEEPFADGVFDEVTDPADR